MKRTAAVAALLLLAGTATAHAQAQQKASNASAATKGISSIYNAAKSYILATAEQVPQEKYSYQPTKEVRTLGQILGHIADSQKMFCAIADGKPAPAEDAGSEKLTDKAALIAVLKDSFAYCDGVLASLTDADLAKTMKVFGQDMNVAAVITMNAAHDMEHYGNLVTYMRLNGMVPPSSQGNGM